MHGQRIGYVGVNSFDQNPERQLEHVPVDRLLNPKIIRPRACKGFPETQPDKVS